jgi:xanthine/uracil permease
MMNDKSIGLLLGLVLCGVAVTGNLLRADPHGVSTYPSLASMAIAPLVVFAVGRHRKLHGVPFDAVRLLGVRVGAIAGAVFAAGIGAYTLYRLQHAPLVAFAVVTAFFSTFVLCSVAGLAAGQRRLDAV